MLPEPMKAWLQWSERPILVLGFVGAGSDVKTVWIGADGILRVTEDDIVTQWRHAEDEKDWFRVTVLDTEPVEVS